MKQQWKQWKAAVAAVLMAVSIAGCAQLGLTPAKGLDQQLAYAEGQVTAVRVSAAQSLLAGTITITEAQGLLNTTDAARTAIDGAKAAEAVGDTSTAQAKLTVVMSTLVGVQQFLQQHAAVAAAAAATIKGSK